MPGTLVILTIIVTMITVQITQGVPHKMSNFRMLFWVIWTKLFSVSA